MNAKPADTNPLPSLADIDSRITDERRRLLTEQNTQVALEGQRLAPLERGDDDALDRIESQISECISRQERIQERLVILARRREEANAKAEDDRLDELTAAAERARERGAKILKTVYPSLAKKLAEALAELRDCEQSITQANYELQAAKRETVESCDPKRYAGPPGPLGLIVGYLALHEAINLPNEQSADVAPYWQCTDTLGGLALYALNVPGQRKLLTP